MPKTLIFGGCCVQNEERRELVTLWARLTRHLNPDTDILLMDSEGAFDPTYFIPKDLNIEIFKYGNNPGHLSHGGGDGAGRTFCDGLEMAYERGYDYAVHLETDFLFARPIIPYVEKLARIGVKAACTWCMFYQFLEWGISMFNTKYMHDIDFSAKYNWQQPPNGDYNYIPEWRVERIVEDELMLLPIRGIRNSQNWVNASTLQNLFPYKPADYITHSDMPTCKRFLEMNGIVLS